MWVDSSYVLCRAGPCVLLWMAWAWYVSLNLACSKIFYRNNRTWFAARLARSVPQVADGECRLERPQWSRQPRGPLAAAVQEPGPQPSWPTLGRHWRRWLAEPRCWRLWDAFLMSFRRVNKEKKERKENVLTRKKRETKDSHKGNARMRDKCSK